MTHNLTRIPTAFLEEAFRLHQTPGRHYHTFDHAVTVAYLTKEAPFKDPRAAFIAGLFHDSIYVVGAKDNEVRSAEAAREACTKHHVSVDLKAVTYLIEYTKYHESQVGLWPMEYADDIRLFLDCDLSILGANSERYTKYEDAVEREYLAVCSKEVYLAGRTKFLEGLLKKPSLFYTQWGLDRYEYDARANIMRSLSQA